MRIAGGESQKIHIEASKKYGGNPIIEVHEGEIYSFVSGDKKTWIDWFIRSSAQGFWNPLLFPSWKRVRNARCFELCGTINRDEEHHFKIGMKLNKYEMSESGQLFFFPNDSIKHYQNNRGYMEVIVTRIS